MNRKRILVIAATTLIAVLASVAAFYLVNRAPLPDERKVLYWTDPMVPGYRSEKPGKSPFMDMELVPVYEDKNTAEGAPAVAVGAQVVQKLGVRTTSVQYAAAERTLATHGYLFRDQGGLLVIADVFERDTSWLRPGLAAQVRVAELADARFAASVERIESDRDIGGRSVKLRVRLQQADARLQANMAAEVIVTAKTAKQMLLVPREALIRTARRNVLIRVLDDGRFQPVEVVAGDEFGEMQEIRSGVQKDEKIVVSGQFLIDSESSVREGLKRLDTEAAPAVAEPKPAHKH